MTASTSAETSAHSGFVTSVSSYWKPQHVMLSAWLEHGSFAFWVIDAARPRSLVELGTHNGFSFFAFCQAVKSLGLQCPCYAIDTWKGDEHAGFYSEDILNGVRSIHQQHYADIATLVRSTFDEALPYFADASIDLLHIDGRHTYEDVRHDYTTWIPKLSQRAVVLFHDINVRERDFGVWKLWEELKTQFPSFEFIHGNGLGVLAIGSNVPAALVPLFNASPADQRLVRATYSRLGKAISESYFSGEDLQVTGAQRDHWEQLAHANAAEASTTRGMLAEARAMHENTVQQLQAMRDDAGAAAGRYTARETELTQTRAELIEKKKEFKELIPKVRQLEELILKKDKQLEELFRKDKDLEELRIFAEQQSGKETELMQVRMELLQKDKDLVALRIFAEQQSRRQYAKLPDTTVFHPIAQHAQNFSVRCPKASRWLWAFARGFKMLMTFQFGRLARAASRRLLRP